MNARIVLDALGEFLWPTRCAGCEMPGAVWCDRCADAARSIDPLVACPRCGAPFGILVCTECWNTEWSFDLAVAGGVFDGELARAVRLHKDASERRLADVFSAQIIRAVQPWEGWVDAVDFVPSTGAAIRRRGYDHCRAIAIGVGDRLGVPCAGALKRGVVLDQRSLGREARAANSRGSFVCESVRGRFLLVDDVMTTGATLEAAAAALLEAGAAGVRVATIARVW